MALVRAMYKKGAGNDKQGKDAGNRTLCPYRNFSQAIICGTNCYGSMKTTLKCVVICFGLVNTVFVRAMYKKGAGNDKQGKDAGNRMLCPYRNFSQAIICGTNCSVR